ncbi:MBL fold metallo-hydrolase [Cellulomonas sp. CW35]|uniref:MBL fold metallo-hydrolase n=1 Tax=Cellulomonas sp. CW35 TaxID=3458249 RepID=UPI004033633F
MLDAGRPLWARHDEHVPLPAVPGLEDGDDPSLLGVVVSHPHLDHYGLLDQVHPSVPVYAGAAASSIVGAARWFSPRGPALRTAGHLRDGESLQLGPFRITPYLVDHSAFDSYALVVEHGDSRLMYTGDLRGHGRKSRLFERMIAQPPAGVTTLLMEGTQVRPASEVTPPLHLGGSESDVEEAMAATFRATPGLAVVAGSPQNVDRLVTTYRAARRAGRTLLVDLYGVAVARATGRSTIPQPGFPAFGVWVPRRQRVLVKERAEFERIAEVRSIRVFPEGLAERPGGYVVFTSSSSVAELVHCSALTRHGVVVWSMWSGYLQEPSGVRLRDLLAGAGVPMVEHHTSGHASVTDLKRLVDAVKPGRVVPIHTDAADAFGEYFPRANVHEDGEWWAA